jgi:hypothetical protein
MFEALERFVERASPMRAVERGCGRADRDRLRLHVALTLSNGTRVGEGTLVRYVGVIANPRYSNVSGGEMMNCKRDGQESNEIHVGRRQNDFAAIHTR